MQKDNPLISNAQAAQILNINPGTLASWRCLGRGPRYVKVGRAVFYRLSALSGWLEAQERDPASKHCEMTVGAAVTVRRGATK